MTGVLWFEAGLRQLFAWQGQFELDRNIFLLDQILVFTHYLPIVYFIFYLFSGKRLIANIFLILFTITSSFALYSLKLGITPTNITYFSTKYITHALTQTIFSAGFAVLFLAAIFTTLKELYKIIKKQNKNWSNFAALFSLVIYFIFGYFDQMGFLSGGYLLLIRLIILATVVLAYFSYAHINPLKL